MGRIMGFTSGFGTGFAEPIAESAISPEITRAARGVRRLGAALLAMALLPGAMPVSDLSIDVINLRSARGIIRLCLTLDPANFPGCIDETRAVTRSVPAATREIRLEGMPHGDYAAAVIHDENGNGKLDSFAGIPREGFGFSRNPVITFGPPRFAAARFTLAADVDKQKVKMRYLL